MTKSHDIVDRLRLFGSSAVEREAADEIDRLRAERDEARRDVCYLRPCVCLGVKTPDEYAQFRGWDCFKEDKP